VRSLAGSGKKGTTGGRRGGIATGWRQKKGEGLFISDFTPPGPI
jgi:hypothetical protein